MSDDISQSVRDRAATIAQVTNIVGKNIFADVLPQDFDCDKESALVIHVPGSEPHEDIGGTNRIYQSTVTTLCYGRDRAEANKLASKVRDYALPPDLYGRVEGMEWQEVTMIGGPEELIEPPPDGSDRYRRLTRQEFIIWNVPV